MSAYSSLAASYDGLTTDVPYETILDFLETILRQSGKRPETALDLACGTGSMSLLLAKRGYRVIASDVSEEMLTVAAQKAGDLAKPPFFICQPMQRLRLPEPVDAVFCLLDSLNYLDEPGDCRKTFARVFKALKPGGVFLFDINTPEKLRGLDGQVFLDENEESYCVWRAEFDEAENCCYYGIDLFQRDGDRWKRSFEQHCEYAYEPQELAQWLAEAGFVRVEQYGDCRMDAPAAGEQRIYFAAYKV
ncbi:MAG: methyltransferase domain-containing protein [Oscillospiraceae bacterium]|nr:methyltransferase domain-containing protein [Oscillospiraceae bacterium]